MSFDRGPRYNFPRFSDPEALSSFDNAWGILDVKVVAYGFLAMRTGSEYLPHMTVQIRVIEPSSRRVICKETFAYTSLPVHARVHHRPIDPADHWKNLKELAGDIPGASAALRKRISDIAAAIALSLNASHAP